MCIRDSSYILLACSRNLTFTSSLVLSKACANGPPGVVIGINQSACSLGSAIGPILAGLGYTGFLSWLSSASAFFASFGAIGALAIGSHLKLPPWPWLAR